MINVGMVRRSGILVSSLLLLASGSASAAIIYGAVGGKTNSNLYTIDTTNAATTVVGPIGFAVTGLAFQPGTGVLYGVTSNQSPSNPHSLITIDPVTGAGTLIGDEQLGNTGCADITFDAAGILYCWSEGSDDLATINIATGKATVVSDSGLSTYGSGIVDVGGTLYFTGRGNQGDLRTVDKVLGVTTVIAPLSGAPGFNGDAIGALTADPTTGTLFGATNHFGASPAFLITIDKVTGVVTTIGQSVDGLDALAFPLAPTLDFGDAPAQYPVTLAQNGARHNVVNGAPFLGSVAPDTEADGQPNANALGDDNNGADDEGGVQILMDQQGGVSSARVVVGGANGLLDAWIDFNKDGDWDDAGEQIFTSQFVTVGTNNLTFNAPVAPDLFGNYFGRFRISSAGGLAPTGAAANGEVEDYLIQVFTSGGGSNDDIVNPPPLPAHGGAFPMATLAGLFLSALLRRRRR